MSKHSKHAYKRSHIPQIGNNPAASFFIERFPVDRRDIEIDTLVKMTIPGHLREGLVVHNSCEEARASSKGGIALSLLNREAALLGASDEERGETARRLAIADALATRSVNYAFMEYSTQKGIMSDFAVAAIDDSVSSGTYHELSGLLDIDDPFAESGEFEIQERDLTSHKILERTPLDHDLALDFLTSISERHTGNLPAPSFSEQIYGLYDASADKYKKTSGNSEFDDLSIDVELEEHTKKSLSRIGSYAITIHQQLPNLKHPSDATVLSFDLRQSTGKYNRREWKANMAMTILTKDPDSTPAARESRFENLADYYRQQPNEFFRSIAKAAERFAALEI